jgi:hypothetical protein
VSSDPRETMRDLQRGANRICEHILDAGYPLVDVQIEREALREECARLFPERLWLFDLVYESRFERLIQQWRDAVPEDSWTFELRPELPPPDWLPG